MRVCRKLDKLIAIALCIFALTLILVLKSSLNIKLVIELLPKVNSSQYLLESDNKLNELMNDSKWKVLNDGTVIHLGNRLFPFDYSYVINNENICKHFRSNSLKVIIFVDSEAINLERRQLIRDTWGLKLLQEAINYRIVFLLGLHYNTTKSNEIQAYICFNLF